ncbi:phytoene/squalene synthase family protein [Corynebacterium sp.]|uniref:phytoene/squalene synthase family protein n=1 Tax=Corynebacterium sp. TaxID=1720 RepID=UPI0026DAFE28|nr:phytoene/squalene synthase family protein [Corynebacterium sp.]MDO4609107.1 phytoene/squalene synthase family protein [Corynebacterium sp.]
MSADPSAPGPAGRRNAAPDDLARARAFAAAVTEEHGRTYGLAVRLLPRDRAAAVHGLYAWARMIDDYVDLEEGVARPLRDPADVEARVRYLDRVLRAAIDWPGEVAGFPVPEPPEGVDVPAEEERLTVVAAADAVRRWDMDAGLFDEFLESMLSDLPGTSVHRAEYRTWAELDRYMRGSAEVIGLLTLPVLGRGAPGTAGYRAAEPCAAELGRAFQITNFLRDVSEDLGRGRIYLPLDEWARFGVGPGDLAAARAAGRATPAIVAAVRHFIAVNRASYRAAEPGVALLRSPAREAIRTAYVLYSGILAELEARGCDPFGGRAVVPVRRRIAVAAPLAALGAARAALGR